MKNLKVGDKVRCKIPYGDFRIGYEHILAAHDLTDNYFMQHFEAIPPLPPAVLVQNEREFKALMEDYEKKGFIWYSTNKPTLAHHSNYHFPCVIELKDRFIALEKEEYECYNIIPLSTYALIAGIELPIETTLDEGATVTLSENRFEFDESVMSLSKNDVINLYNLIKDHMY